MVRRARDRQARTGGDLTRRPVTIRRIGDEPLVVNGQTLTAAQATRFRDMTAKVFQGQLEMEIAETPADKAFAKRVEQAGVSGLRALADELSAAEANAQTNIDNAEALAIRARMGDVAEGVAGTPGAMRLVTASGVAFAHSRGVLDGQAYPAARLLEAGLLYGKCFASVGAMLTPNRPEVRGSSGGMGHLDAAVACGQTLAIMRRGQAPRIIKTLDWVCGHDMTVKRAAAALGSDPRTIERRLRTGLVTAIKNRNGE